MGSHSGVTENLMPFESFFRKLQDPIAPGTFRLVHGSGDSAADDAHYGAGHASGQGAGHDGTEPEG